MTIKEMEFIVKALFLSFCLLPWASEILQAFRELSQAVSEKGRNHVTRGPRP